MRLALFILAVMMVNGAAVQGAERFSGPLGLQLYSLRREAARDFAGTLRAVKQMGFDEVEVADIEGKSPQEIRTALDAAGLAATGVSYGYDRFDTDLAGVVRDAKTLGAQYVVIAWIPHQPPFAEPVALKAAADFNRWGQALAAEGLSFAYHAHGFEFQPHGNGTLFDILVSRTDARSVGFQMDVFWVMHAGQDPVALLDRLGPRVVSMHLKDLRKGEATGVLTARAPEDAFVVLGAGQVDWPAVLKAAARAGVKRYYIEDEAVQAIEQIPQSLAFLKAITF